MFKKAPLLAVLAFAPACDDAEKIEKVLDRSAPIQVITEKLKTQCQIVIREGTVRMSAGLNGDFTATLRAEDCECSNEPSQFCGYAAFAGWENLPYNRITVVSDERSALVDDEEQKIHVNVKINDDGECVVEQRRLDEDTNLLESNDPRAVSLCRAFIDRVKNTVVAIRQMVKEIR